MLDDKTTKPMKKIFFMLCLCLMMLGIIPLSGQGIAGTWKGTMETPQGKLAVILRITAGPEGYTTTMDSPNQGLKDLPTTHTKFEDDILTVTADRLGMIYEGVVNGGIIKGNMMQSGYVMPLDLRREKDAQVAIIKEINDDPAGTWNGVLDFGRQKLRIVFHIRKTGNGYSATMESPDQGAKDIPATETTFKDGILKVTESRSRMVFEGTLDGDKIIGTFTQGGRIPLILERGAAVINRPQEPLPPYPYNSEDIRFENREAGITLAGTFTYPKDGKKFPAVVLLTGSGAQDRNEEVYLHKPFLVLADYLTRNGIAVLRFDDRGTGESGGDYRSATLQDFATDAAAAVDYLKTRREVERKKIGFLGHSEGGSIMLIVGAGRKDIAFYVSLAGSGVKGSEISKDQRRRFSDAQGINPQAMEINESFSTLVTEVLEEYGIENLEDNMDEMVQEVIASAHPIIASTPGIEETVRVGLRELGSPEMFSFTVYDPADDLKRIRRPILALYGEKDWQISPALNAEGLKLRYDGDLTIKVYPELNHLFQHSNTGNPAEYGTIEETISPEVLEDIAAWINKKTKNRNR